MHHFFKEYYWQRGVPKGETRVDPLLEEESYKIVTDPYGKRFSVEKYHRGDFNSVLYDSSLLDFRQLIILEQTPWHRSRLAKDSDEGEDCEASIIRNQDDRVILLEKQFFQDNWCRECRLYTPWKQHLSTHFIFYIHLGDPFNGVVLKDPQDHFVMFKKYEVDDQFQFTQLIEEQWDMKNVCFALQNP
jgi:hypothetical protein